MSWSCVLPSVFRLTPSRFLSLACCLTSQQHVSVSRGRICSNRCTCCHTEIEFADQSFYRVLLQYTDTGPACPSADPVTPGVWKGSNQCTHFCHWHDDQKKRSTTKAEWNPGLLLSRRSSNHEANEMVFKVNHVMNIAQKNVSDITYERRRI